MEPPTAILPAFSGFSRCRSCTRHHTLRTSPPHAAQAREATGRRRPQMFVKRGLSAAIVVLGLASPAMAADIVDTAVDAGQFNTLAAALKAAGLVETLKGPGPFTVFAPTDEAFKKLPAGTVEDLLKPENKQKLVEVLTYHVVPGKV